MYGLQQLISEPKKLLANSLSSTDLVFTDQLNLAVDSDVHPFLHPNSHHEIIYCKFNLMTEHSPPYEILAWDYKHSDEKAIAKAIFYFF